MAYCKNKISTLAFFYVLVVLVAIACENRSNFEDFDEVLEGQQPPHSFLLTWLEDPTSTIVIDWHTVDVNDNLIQYRERGKRGWVTQKGVEIPSKVVDSLFILRAELSDLSSGQSYEFRFNPDEDIYKFRTMPKELSRPITFVTGGDVRHKNSWMKNMNKIAVANDPDFVLLGGDLSYANGEDGPWYDYLKVWSETMITADNRVIPQIVSIGNHEVRSSYVYRYENEYEQNDEVRFERAPFFYSLFAFPGQPGFQVLDFGQYLSIFVLDSGHTNPVLGLQEEWLSQELSNRKNVDYKIPIYHIAAYPSVRAPDASRIHERIRSNWSPLFEDNGVRVVFENHDHAYKRTYPIINNQVDQDGVYYIGDGAWGVETRSIGANQNVRPWYLDKTESIRHLIKVSISNEGMYLEMLNENRIVFDELYLPSK